MSYGMIKKLRKLNKTSQKHDAIAEILNNRSPSVDKKNSNLQKHTAKIKTEKKLIGKTILISLWFRSLIGGGLHENVYDTVKFIKESGGNAIIVCPASELSKRLISEENIVYETDFERIQDLAEKISLEHQNISLIHVHPGKARHLGEAIKKILDKPIVITIHGKWFDGIEKNNKKYSRIIGVSEHICDVIKQQATEGRYKLTTIENSFSEDIFYLKRSVANVAVFCGRLDNDKRASIEMLYDIWHKQSIGELPIFSWIIAGDGPLREELQEKAASIFLGVTQLVTFLGWKSRTELSEIYQRALFMIGAGRTSLEALACGCPVIACANELETSAPIYSFDSYLDIAYSNFGSFGSINKENKTSNPFEFIKSLIKRQNAFSEAYKKIANHLIKTRSSNVIAEKTINCYLDVLDENS